MPWNNTDNNFEKLQTEVSEIQRSLDWLSKEAISDVEKNAKKDELKERAERVKSELEWEKNKLEWKKDAESILLKEKVEALLNTINELIILKLAINPSEVTAQKDTSTVSAQQSELQSPTLQDWSQTLDSEKWFFKRTWEWIWEKRSSIPQWAKSLVKIAWAAIAWTWLYKKLFKKDKKKDEKEESDKKESSSKWWFWEKPVWKAIKWFAAFAWISSWVYYITHWLITKNWNIRDMFDWEIGKKLDFNDAMWVAEWNIINQSDNKSMSHWIELSFDETTSEIIAYWERIKINKNARKIEWLNISFKKYEHLISTAILIAYLKKNYSWQCLNNSPFSLSSSWRWNMNVTSQEWEERAANWTWRWWRIIWVTSGALLWIISWIYGWLGTWAVIWTSWSVVWLLAGTAIDTDNILHKYMPELDSGYWLNTLAWYLNNLNCWEARHQTEDDVTESPIKAEVVECVRKLQGSNPNQWIRWDRKLDAIQDINDPTKYTIKAYWRDFKAQVTWEWENKEIKLLWIEWWNPSVTLNSEKKEVVDKFLELKYPLKQWIYLSSLIGFLLSEYSFKWNDYPYFYFGTRVWFSRWIYFKDKWADTYVQTEKSLKENMPKVFDNKEIFINFLNDGLVWSNNDSIWRDPKSYKK